MEFLKEYVETWSSRVKSPIFGSIVTSFLIFNWKSFYYLFFAETNAAIRIRFFEINIHSWQAFVFPVLIGLALAYCLPWINLAGSHLALAPLQRSRDIQINETIRLKAARIRAEADLANAQIEREKAAANAQIEREKAAIELNKNLVLAEKIGGSELKDVILADRMPPATLPDPDEVALLHSLATLDDFRKQLTLEIGDSSEGVTREVLERSTRIRDAMKREAPDYADIRFETKLNTSLGHLSGQSMIVGGPPWKLTEHGYRVYDRLRQRT